ncbi:MAG: 30S ribosomal protein S6 [Acidobacteriota bacterium]
MLRTYELGIVVEPRQTDDDVQAIAERFHTMIEEVGARVTEIDHWGKRKLAYPIEKFNEGRYVFLYVTTDGPVPPWPEIERLLQQDERVLRHLVVRTDEDLKRAMRKGKVKPTQVANAELFADEETKKQLAAEKAEKERQDAEKAAKKAAAEAPPAEGEASAEKGDN